jgi:hypothetical protein
VTGERIVQISWASVALFGVVGVLDVFIDAFDPVALGVCVALFLCSLPVWLLRARTRDRAVEPR